MLLLLTLLTNAVASSILFIEGGLDKIDIDSFAESLHSNAAYKILSESTSELMMQENHRMNFDIHHCDVIVCGSRGATILTLLLNHNSGWNGNVIIFSPILRECDLFPFDLNDKYDQGLEIALNVWSKSNAKVFIGIGNSTDEKVLIHDPLMEILQSDPYIKDRITVKQYHGDHDWFSKLNQSQFQQIRSFIGISAMNVARDSTKEL